MSGKVLDKDLYIILSGINNHITLLPKGFDWEHRHRTFPIVGVQSVAQPKWRLWPLEGNLYKVSLAGDEPSHLQVENGKLWLVGGSLDNATQFSIEPAGKDLWRMHIPDQDQVCRLDKESEQVRIAKEDGTNNELWQFSPWQFP